MKLNLNKNIKYGNLENVTNEEFKVDNKSALFIVDMNNGFVKEGALSSDRVKAIIPNVVKTAQAMYDLNNPIIAITDSHKDNSLEFNFYPTHCLEGSKESEVIEELNIFSDKMEVFTKETTNALIEKEIEHRIFNLILEGVKNFIVVGCITEVCINQFATSLRVYLNKNGFKGDVIVPIDSVDTFDSENHDADIVNIFSLAQMQSNGIKIVNNIKK